MINKFEKVVPNVRAFLLNNLQIGQSSQNLQLKKSLDKEAQKVKVCVIDLINKIKELHEKH
jgi:hypothetical protein